MRLLFYQWINGAIPQDPERLARICRIHLKTFLHRWDSIQFKFIQNGKGQLQNMRLEKTREEQRKYSESRKIGASVRWKDHDAHAMHAVCIDDALQSSTSSLTTTTKEKKVIKKRTPPTGVGYTPEFLEFWKAYPQRIGKGDAFRSWVKMTPPLSRCLQAIEEQKKGRKWKEGFIPNPATWINQRRWEDEVQPEPGHAKEKWEELIEGL